MHKFELLIFLFNSAFQKFSSFQQTGPLSFHWLRPNTCRQKQVIVNKHTHKHTHRDTHKTLKEKESHHRAIYSLVICLKRQLHLCVCKGTYSKSLFHSWMLVLIHYLAYIPGFLVFRQFCFRNYQICPYSISPLFYMLTHSRVSEQSLSGRV